MTEDLPELPPLVEPAKLLAVSLPELVRLLGENTRVLSECRIAMTRLADVVTGLALELQRERAQAQRPEAQRFERPRVGEKFRPPPMVDKK